MKNLKGTADVVVVTAPYNVLSGQGVQVGTIVGIAQTDATSGTRVAIVRSGVFTHAKTASQAWTDGQAVYWDNTNRVFSNASAGNTLVGSAMGAVAGGAGDTTGTVLLKGL